MSATGCMSSAQASLGDKQIAMKLNPKFDGTGQSKKFENLKPEATVSASEAELEGRQ